MPTITIINTTDSIAELNARVLNTGDASGITNNVKNYLSILKVGN